MTGALLASPGAGLACTFSVIFRIVGAAAIAVFCRKLRLDIFDFFSSAIRFPSVRVREEDSSRTLSGRADGLEGYFDVCNNACYRGSVSKDGNARKTAYVSMSGRGFEPRTSGCPRSAAVRLRQNPMSPTLHQAEPPRRPAHVRSDNKGCEDGSRRLRLDGNLADDLSGRGPEDPDRVRCARIRETDPEEIVRGKISVGAFRRRARGRRAGAARIKEFEDRMGRVSELTRSDGDWRDEHAPVPEQGALIARETRVRRDPGNPGDPKFGRIHLRSAADMSHVEGDADGRRRARR